MIMEHFFDKRDSSFVKYIRYDINTEELYIGFHTWLDPITYVDVPPGIVEMMFQVPSIGKFYLSQIKNVFSIKKENIMADKIIKLKINVLQLNKEWFFKGEKGLYADITVLYNEKQDQYGNNGLVTQDVPKAIFQTDKTIRGPILGNCKDWATQERPAEAQPGQESGVMVGNNGVAQEFADDLPF